MKQFLIAIDQGFNTLVWLKSEGFGMATETLSARAWRLRHDSNGYKIINLLFFWQDNHCKGAYENRLNDVNAPKEYR
ncbi:hypothetical protein [Thiomicrorhabdus lithotrophica]|uniref:Uncharacterized protein n=1 Tax=Thiomicrorhabdus lithotrophica TaxID=2949997 RepID=A0ABY8C859_9GAMM|nr:hypothetical protein [Thiomicrorhabdus lithotrophica]WEJ62144.1 hypothetical protein NR989_09000 [Thiomicrorhabdus lithotrophica]